MLAVRPLGVLFGKRWHARLLRMALFSSSYPKTRASATRCRAGRFSLGDAPAIPRHSRPGSRAPRRHASQASALALSPPTRVCRIMTEFVQTNLIAATVKETDNPASDPECGVACPRKFGQFTG